MGSSAGVEVWGRILCLAAQTVVRLEWIYSWVLLLESVATASPQCLRCSVKLLLYLSCDLYFTVLKQERKIQSAECRSIAASTKYATLMTVFCFYAIIYVKKSSKYMARCMRTPERYSHMQFLNIWTFIVDDEYKSVEPIIRKPCCLFNNQSKDTSRRVLLASLLYSLAVSAFSWIRLSQYIRLW